MPKLAYLTHPIKSIQGGGESVDLTFIDPYNYTKPDPAKITVRWYREAKGDWQGAEILLSNPSLAEVARIKKMTGALDSATDGDVDLDDPDAMLVALVRDGSFQVVHDPRLKRFVELEKVKDNGKQSWQAKGMDVFVQAETEEQAQGHVARNLATMCAEKPEEWADKMASWFKTGRKVVKIEDAKAPTAHPDTVYCKRSHQRAAALKREGKKKVAEDKEEKAAK